jgi:hypothetical protein
LEHQKFSPTIHSRIFIAGKTQVAAFYTLQALGALIGSLVLPQLADRFSPS